MTKSKSKSKSKPKSKPDPKGFAAYAKLLQKQTETALEHDRKNSTRYYIEKKEKNLDDLKPALQQLIQNVPYHKYSQDERAKAALILYIDNQDTALTCAQLGVHQTTISAYLRKLGICRKGIEKLRLPNVTDYIKEGKTDKEIAALLCKRYKTDNIDESMVKLYR